MTYSTAVSKHGGSACFLCFQNTQHVGGKIGNDPLYGNELRKREIFFVKCLYWLDPHVGQVPGILKLSDSRKHLFFFRETMNHICPSKKRLLCVEQSSTGCVDESEREFHL